MLITESGESESRETGSVAFLSEIEIRGGVCWSEEELLRRREPYEVEVRETRW